MSYVPNYKNDIFVSYAIVDDNPFPGVQTGWVTTLINSIQIRLAQRLGRSDAYTLWMDHQLARHVKLTPQIMDALRQTAIMIIVLSPGYLGSDWCKREKNIFLELIKESDSRVFIIERDIIEVKDLPVEFQDQLTFRFWVKDREGKPPRILGEPVPDKDDRSYYDRVDEVVFELVDELRELRKEHEGVAGAVLENKQQPAVYLAEVTDDLEQERTSLKTYLSQFGINVLPNTCYSQDPTLFRQSVERDLAKCVAFVQLLSSSAGKKPPDLPQGYVQFQFELAKTSQKTIFQWRSPSLDMALIQDEHHRAFVFDGPTVQAEGIENFKRTIEEFVLKSSAPSEPKPLSAFVFVNMETADRPLAEKVCSVLSCYGIGYSLPLNTGDPADKRKDLEDNLLYSNGIIIIYGSSTVVWVRRQLMECTKILSMRDQPLQAFAVFEGPPEEKGPIDFLLPKLQFFNFRKGLDDALLKRELTTFIGKLGKEGA
jgi:hypothetical protein